MRSSHIFFLLFGDNLCKSLSDLQDFKRGLDSVFGILDYIDLYGLRITHNSLFECWIITLLWDYCTIHDGENSVEIIVSINVLILFTAVLIDG